MSVRDLTLAPQRSQPRHLHRNARASMVKTQKISSYQMVDVVGRCLAHPAAAVHEAGKTRQILPGLTAR
jgi:hypothetical protein